MPRTTFDVPAGNTVSIRVDELCFPSHISIEPAPCTNRITTCGWHYRLFEAADRYIALYVFEDQVGIVRAAGPLQDLLPVLDSARPDWTGAGVIALHELWS